MRLSQMKGLGPASERALAEVGIDSAETLKRVGPVQAYLRLAAHTGSSPSVNLLYALVGAIENRSWIDVARTDRLSLLSAIENHDAGEFDQDSIDNGD